MRHLFSPGIRSSPVIARCRRSLFAKQPDRESAPPIECAFPSSPPFQPFPFPSPSTFLFRSDLFSPAFFPPPRRPSRVLSPCLPPSRSCVSYVRTNSISRDSLRSWSAVNYFSDQTISPCPSLLLLLLRHLRSPCTVHPFFCSSFFLLLVSPAGPFLLRLFKADSLNAALKKRQLTRGEACRGTRICSVDR